MNSVLIVLGFSYVPSTHSGMIDSNVGTPEVTTLSTLYSRFSVLRWSPVSPDVPVSNDRSQAMTVDGRSGGCTARLDGGRCRLLPPTVAVVPGSLFYLSGRNVRGL